MGPIKDLPLQVVYGLANEVLFIRPWGFRRTLAGGSDRGLGVLPQIDVVIHRIGRMRIGLHRISSIGLVPPPAEL